MEGSLTDKRQEASGLMVTTMLFKKSFQSEVAGASKKLTPVGLADVEPTWLFRASELAEYPLKA